ncbi:MAG: hypothetical protein WC838_00115, partial [Candidatus Margulisiibacteriota bacterium]
KIAGSPADHPDKAGIRLEKLVIEKIFLTKTDPVLNPAQIFSSFPEKPLEIEVRNNKRYLVFKPCGQGLAVGDRNLLLRKDGDQVAVEYEIKDSQSYSGLYSNIFDVSRINELELAAEMGGVMQKHGQPPNWATNTIELNYFDEFGAQVYPADNGEERYQNIHQDPDQRQQIRKGFFAVPHERGARYAQVKMHVTRLYDNEAGTFDRQNYFTGRSHVAKVYMRTALPLINHNNFAPQNGTLYKQRNGRPLDWSSDGITIEEDLAASTRQVKYENTDKDWSVLKTQLNVPEDAGALRGFLNIDVQNIQAGLEQWQGFGLFLEADVVDNSGNIFHYEGIPVFKKEGKRLVRLERIATKTKAVLEYYVPLYHENLRITKLTWQLALAGKGRVVLLPLTGSPNASIVKLEFLKGGDLEKNPALWSQYGLNEANGNELRFQKHYQMEKAGQRYVYDSAESLNDHLAGAWQNELNIVEDLKKLRLGAELRLADVVIRALPSYSRVNKEYVVPAGAQAAYLKFVMSGAETEASFNIKTVMLNSSGNILEAPFLLRGPSSEAWFKVAANKDVMALRNGGYELLMPLQRKGFLADRFRLTLGGNQGEVAVRELRIAYLPELPAAIKNADNLSASYLFSVDGLKQENIFTHLSLDKMDLAVLANKDKGYLDNREMYPIEQGKQVLPAMNIFEHEELKAVNQQIRASIKAGKATYSKGEWFYQPGESFQQVGFTIVGETFNKWFELRSREFSGGVKDPSWSASLNPLEQKKLKLSANSAEYIKMSFRAQSRLWQKWGINTIRVHQLFASWSGLDKEKIGLTIDILKMLQQEEGFLIVFDMMPNPDFTSPLYKEALAGKPYAKDLSDTNLFKATLALPEVSDVYVKTAAGEILKAFQTHDFWPNSLSYCNETGLVHGFWLIDRNNPAAHPYFSRVYHYYYDNYLKELQAYPGVNAFIEETYPLLQTHVQSVKMEQLVGELDSVVKMLKAKRRIKDNASYVYYNLLRDGVAQQYSYYGKELKDLKENFRGLVQNTASLKYYEDAEKKIKQIEDKLAVLKQENQARKKENAEKLVLILRDTRTIEAVNGLQARVFQSKMPNSYQIPKGLGLEYIDTFEQIDSKKRVQAFFTSFLLPVRFCQDIDSLLNAKNPTGSFSIGLNNDYIKDVYALLANSYLFVNSEQQELRFNKYTHHPLGGYSMLSNAGQGNVFDEDSNLDLNLKLFTPLLAAGYKAQMSEANYTFAGDDRAGQENWTAMDYLKLISQGDHLLAFRLGLNNLDNPIITDYFDIGNRAFKLEAMAFAGALALARNTSGKYQVQPGSFQYDRFQQKISLSSEKVSGLAGSFSSGGILYSKDGKVGFKYLGQRNKVDLCILRIELGQDILVDCYGIMRNNKQQNRPANPDLVQSYGVPPIMYQAPKGVLAIKLKNDGRGTVEVFASTPSQRVLKVPSEAYRIERGTMLLDTAKAGKGLISFRVKQK